jgi:hypothetical protein
MMVVNAFLPSHSSILGRRNKLWSFESIAQRTVLRLLWGLTDPQGIGRRSPQMMLLNRRFPEPQFARRLKAKTARWTPSPEKRWLPFGSELMDQRCEQKFENGVLAR